MGLITNPIIAEYGTWFLILALLFGLYLTWGIGANDVSNAIGTSVGSGALTIKQGIIIAGIFEFAGALLAGGRVADTLKAGIVDASYLSATPELFILGMLAALLAAGTWTMLASSRGWPVSTTHAIVGALVGFGVVGIGIQGVHWQGMSEIAASWVFSPVLSAIIGYLLMRSVQTLVFESNDPFASAGRLGPAFVFLAGYAVALLTLAEGLKNYDLNLNLADTQKGAILTGIICAIISMFLIRRIKIDKTADQHFHFASVEKIFAPMMIFSACAMAFAHGSNDVGNGIGPIAAIFSMVQSASLATAQTPIPFWLLLAGGVAILVGVVTYGFEVIKTIGARITELTPSRGYCATLGAAITVSLASGLGLPVSTTHIAVGAVIGVGLARGISALDTRVLGTILLTWFTTLPVSALLAAVFFYALRGLFQI